MASSRLSANAARQQIASARCLERQSARAGQGDEAGAVLVLALIFLVAVSLIVVGLLNWVGTSLHATGTFQDERNVEYAATNAVNLAIQNTRYTFDYGTTNPNVSPDTPMLNDPSPQLCATFTVPGATTFPPVSVYCTMVWQAYSANTRIFTYSACDTTVTPANCAAQPLLQAIVAFDDYPSGVASPSPVPSQCTPILQQTPGGPENGSCGVSMTQVSWQWRPIVPAITSLSTSSGSTAGGTTVVVRGTGFTSGATVNFVEEPQELTTGAYNPAVAATATTLLTTASASCPNPPCIQATSPAVTTGRAYFVEVTTPGGTSQTDPTSSFVPTFTYAPTTPTVIGLTGTTAGSITGNTLVTIQGTGLWNAPNNSFPAQAFFCPTGTTPQSNSECAGGVGCTTVVNNVPRATNCVVSLTPPPANSSTFTMTALSPAVSNAGTYYLQVEVFNVYSTQTNAVFTYSVQAPLVVSLNPTSGHSGTGSITIAGANFLTGSTVGFCAETNGTVNNNQCPTNTGLQIKATTTSLTATQIVIGVPTLPAGSYYPIITLPAPAGNGIPPSQPYNQPADIFTSTG